MFFFTKSKDYYYDADAIREPHVTFTEKSRMRGGRRHFGVRNGTPEVGKNGGSNNLHDGRWDQAFHPLGRNKRTVWSIPLSKFRDAHFAVFPESLVERQLQIRVQRLIRDLSRQGINPQRLDVDWSKIREDQQQQAVRDVKGSLILEHISDKENIAVNDEEIQAEIEKIAAETNRPVEKVREVLSRDSGLERLRGQIRNKKTLDLLQEKAISANSTSEE